ncbi:hypothetical protein E3983_12785 [Legionella israelensis]|uniref:SMP-30/Gluconolactonase/LRE-like region domain-containing protein n=1 Tax=Legionella israelensis TaxID=454 RepID=A0AAX1EK21_9GAMM|nr:SMP-30/gluconolactonase/LRE family protein [Legionella israelensis]QBR85149.1 hypothetical protein E3983_12785 [Legionella israelensis]
MADTDIFIEGLLFPEAGRWYQDKLWFVDIWDQKVYQADKQGQLTEIVKIKDKPAGLGWLSDGTLLITSLFDRLLLSYDGKDIKTYADLNEFAPPGYCHDMVVSEKDIIYLSNSGFYPGPQAKVISSPIIKIDGHKISYAAKELGYPNGIIIKNQQLYVAETFASRLTVFDIDEQGNLNHRRILKQFDDLGFTVRFDEQGVPLNLERVYIDGICAGLKNTLWLSSPGGDEVIQINDEGEVLQRIKTRHHPFDCIHGSDNVLYIMTTSAIPGKREGFIEAVSLA